MEHDTSPSVALRRTRLAVVVVFVGGLIAFFALGGRDWLTLDALKAHRDGLLELVARHYWATLGGALLVYAGAVALSVPGASVLSLAMGLLFGRWLGTLLIVIAATLGAVLVFLAARHLFADAARRRLGRRAEKIIDGFRRNAFHYLLFLRLVPLFPFWLVNLVAALTPISLRTYTAATALGIIPGAFVFANLGQSLGRINSSAELMSPGVLAALALLGLFALLPIAIKKFRARHHTAPQRGHDA